MNINIALHTYTHAHTHIYINLHKSKLILLIYIFTDTIQLLITLRLYYLGVKYISKFCIWFCSINKVWFHNLRYEDIYGICFICFIHIYIQQLARAIIRIHSDVVELVSFCVARRENTLFFVQYFVMSVWFSRAYWATYHGKNTLLKINL